MKFASALACALGLILLTIPVVLRVPIPGDLELVRLTLGLRSDLPTVVIGMLAFITSSVPALLVTLIISSIEAARLGRLSMRAGWATLAFGGGALCNIALRTAVGRLAPKVAYIPNLLPELQAPFQRFSYPSGHAGSALLAYGALVALAWPHAKWRWRVLALSVLVIAGTGVGRVYLGVHWPTDVLGGYLLAGCWLSLGLILKTKGEAQP